MMTNSTARQVPSYIPNPSKIEHKGLTFLITDRPTDESISTYIEVGSTH